MLAKGPLLLWTSYSRAKQVLTTGHPDAELLGVHVGYETQRIGLFGLFRTWSSTSVGHVLITASYHMTSHHCTRPMVIAVLCQTQRCHHHEHTYPMYATIITGLRHVVAIELQMQQRQ